MIRLPPRYAARLDAWRGQARQSWWQSPLRGWLQAWRRELVGMLPTRLAARLGQRDAAQLIAWPLPQGVEAERPTVLVLAPEQVMAQHISLPLAATRNLHKVLQYELDKYTPYPAEQVHFVARVVKKHATHAQVELVAIAKADLNQKLAACRERGLSLVALDAQDTTGERRHVNLLPMGAGQGAARAGAINRWLALGVLALSVATAMGFVHQRQQQVEAMRQEVAGQRQALAQLQQRRQRLDETVGASRYLAGLKASQPTMSRLLAELTACLGEGNWLSRLDVQDGEEVTFSGQSRRASALITQVQTCPSLEQVRFQGVISTDETTGHERFSISARLVQGEPHASDD